ncbi:MAG: hypothetical protein KKA73_30315 [Chloroflexi bacterium]|nr:hypothetical protein [Chloroflexota bacterium]MBU1879028.1 hypothetical protein [Chloroflexota bacterium]
MRLRADVADDLAAISLGLWIGLHLVGGLGRLALGGRAPAFAGIVLALAALALLVALGALALALWWDCQSGEEHG